MGTIKPVISYFLWFLIVLMLILGPSCNSNPSSLEEYLIEGDISGLEQRWAQLVKIDATTLSLARKM